MSNHLTAIPFHSMPGETPLTLRPPDWFQHRRGPAAITKRRNYKTLNSLVYRISFPAARQVARDVPFTLRIMSKQYPAPPSMTIDPSKQYTATLDTSRGTIVVDLFPKEAPKTVNNFAFLARDGFYDGTVFHRVISNFMIQGGDPTATGRGGPGYQFEDEVKGNPRKHKAGSLSMANAGPNTNGSQFFITHVPTDWLDGKHTVFGQVRSGQEVVNAVKQGDKLNSVKIEES